MVNIVEQAKNNAGQLQRNILGEPYNYADQIKTTKQLGMSDKGDLATLERDVNLLLKTYSSINVIGKEFEDQLENPFHELRMISKNIDGTFGCYIQPRESLSPYVLGFCIAEIQTYFSQSDLLSAERDFSIIPVSDDQITHT